jgi:hypothetical protein
MTEVGDIFDYQMSAMVFGYISVSFMAAYGLVAILMAARSKAHPVATLRPAWQSSNQWVEYGPPQLAAFFISSQAINVYCRDGWKVLINALLFATKPLGGWPSDARDEPPPGTKLRAAVQAIKIKPLEIAKQLWAQTHPQSATADNLGE